MLHLFGRKEVFKTPSAQDAARAWGILRANGIPYAVTTKGAGTSFARKMHVSMVSRVTLSATRYGEAEGAPDYLYIIYVNKEDYQRATRLIG